MNKTLLINQPGRHGDIIICLPIAKWYSHAFKVDWLCPEEYHINFRNIKYCTPVAKIEKKYDKIIDLSFGLNTNTDLHRWWIETREQWQSFIIPKYVISQVPLQKRWCLTWKRNKEACEKEQELYERIVNKYGEKYSIVHQSTHDFSMDIEAENKVLFEPIEGYNIFDWFLVLLKAKEIHCIDSCLCNFVEAISSNNIFIEKPKYYYITTKVPNIWDRTLLVNNWRFKGLGMLRRENSKQG
jgi:hypothetical protein